MFQNVDMDTELKFHLFLDNKQMQHDSYFHG